jgi:hypothetical protein
VRPAIRGGLDRVVRHNDPIISIFFCTNSHKKWTKKRGAVQLPSRVGGPFLLASRVGGPFLRPPEWVAPSCAPEWVAPSCARVGGPFLP